MEEPDGEAAMRITSKGHGTIPVEIRSRSDSMQNTEVPSQVDGNTVRLRKARGGG